MMNKENKPKNNDKKNLRHKVSTVIVAIGMILAIAACVYLFVQYAEGKSPSLLGYKFYYILTDSMEPELRVNDVIISKTINSAQEAKMKVKEGDVVTYIAAEGAQKGMTITHKVIKEPHIDQRTGKEVILTKGVKPGAPVDAPVPLENVQAVMAKRAVFLSYIYRTLISGWGMILLVGLPLGIMLGILVFRLISQIKTPPSKYAPAKNKLSPEEIARRAVEEYKEKERIEEIARKAVEEYIKNNEGRQD
ncbi:MAG: signal peptidase I [Christensenellales bacterium]|mgnify:CR=1 FL=1|jgi:signal peptidase I|nr:signal peptidase I [Clostridiales bacterium]